MVGKLSANLSSPSVLTFGGSVIAIVTSAVPRTLAPSMIPTRLHAASQVCGTAVGGHPCTGLPCVPGGRHASAIVLRQADGARISWSGSAGYQSLRGAPIVGR